MQFLFHSHPGIYGRASSGTDEADVLQTDVMRFMAILGICLMIIFALVKAIPMTPPDASPIIESQDSLNREIQGLKSRISTLRTELAEVLSDIKGAKQKRTAVTQSLLSIKNELETSRQNLAEMGKALKERKTPFSKMRHEMKKEAVNIRKQEQALARQRKSAPVSPTEDVTQEGFVVRFVSDAALTALIEKRVIQFYAMIGKTARELRIKDGVARYDTSSRPSSFYEMSSRTVPESYIDTLKQAVAVLGDNVTWGVILPEKIQKRIHLQMAGKTGGILVIHSNGQVVYRQSEQEETHEIGH